MVVEQMMGHTVKLYPGAYENIKITTPEDLLVAEAFLQEYTRKLSYVYSLISKNVKTGQGNLLKSMTENRDI